MRLASLFVAVLLLATLALLGCQPAAKQPIAVAPPATVEVPIGSRAEYDALLAKHKGEVVLVDFWATWCGPCTENFPHTVELANKYKPDGLATIAVSLDDPDNLPDVQKFLAQHQVTFDNLLSKDGASSESMEAFDLNSAVPHYRLYDRTGKVRMQSDGLPDDLETQLQALLAEKP